MTLEERQRNNVIFRWGQNPKTPIKALAIEVPHDFINIMCTLGFVRTGNTTWVDETRGTKVFWCPCWDYSDVGPNQTYSEKGRYTARTQLALHPGSIFIFDWMWESRKKQVKNYLTSKFVDSSNNIYARVCEVEEIPKSMAYKFLEDNHIQGASTKDAYCLGLYYKDTLVQVMTFSPKRYGGYDEWELRRLCSYKQTHVVGGASKMFDYFLEQKKPNKVIAYATKGLFTGQVYEDMGFTRGLDTPPSATFYNPIEGVVRSRESIYYESTLDHIFQSNWNNNRDEYLRSMQAAYGSYRGYYRVHNCGNAKYEWTRI